MRTAIILAALLVTGGIGLVAADLVDAQPLPCEPQQGEGYVAVVCSDPHRGCVVVSYDGQTRYCSP